MRAMSVVMLDVLATLLKQETSGGGCYFDVACVTSDGSEFSSRYNDIKIE